MYDWLADLCWDKRMRCPKGVVCHLELSIIVFIRWSLECPSISCEFCNCERTSVSWRDWWALRKWKHDLYWRLANWNCVAAQIQLISIINNNICITHFSVVTSGRDLSCIAMIYSHLLLCINVSNCLPCSSQSAARI